MRNTINLIFITALLFCACSSIDSSKNNTPKVPFEKWKEGYMDVHHINTGSGNTSFVVFPDGTTAILDAGDLDKLKFEKKYHPLKATAPVPDDKTTTAEKIEKYLKKVAPSDNNETIDFGIITHFHDDHYASFVDLGKNIPYKVVIDRNFPTYDFPLDLKSFLKDDPVFQDYLNFIEDNKVEALQVGKSDQIVLKRTPSKYPSFKVKNIKSNATIWTGEKEEVFEYFKPTDMTSFYKGKYNENPLSLAVLISYGDFDYFAGGDNTGLQGYGFPDWFDVETPIAKVVNKVEALTLNHHGNRDATNFNFVKSLDPQVVIQQLWCSDHPGQEVYQRLIYEDSLMQKRDIFSTNMHPETIVTYGPWFKNSYKSLQGHILIRVLPQGKEFMVFVLNETDLSIKEKYGPYKCNKVI